MRGNDIFDVEKYTIGIMTILNILPDQYLRHIFV